jgi:F0F1-type ATP synthase membrane subunit b/b'
MSKENDNVTPKQYAHIATRVLNRAIKKREQQIASTEAGNPTSKKTLAQLRHELSQMMNELMERAMAKSSTQDSEPKEPHEDL